MIFVFFMFFMRQLQSGGGKAMSFGKSRARLVNESANKVTFEDVAGVDLLVALALSGPPAPVLVTTQDVDATVGSQQTPMLHGAVTLRGQQGTA